MPLYRKPPRRPVRPPESFLDLLFPVQGLDLSQPFSQQRPRTTPIGQNVRAYEPNTQRARGGQRPGLLSYVFGQVNGNFNIQDINALTDTTGTGGGFGTQGTQTEVWTRTPADSLQIGNIQLSNGSSNVFSYASGGLCGSPVVSINVPASNNAVFFALAGSTTGALVWEIVQVYPGKFIASGQLPGNQPTLTPYVGSTAVDTTNSKFFVVSTQGLTHSVARITTAGAADYTNTTTLTVALSQGNANACSFSVLASSVIYTVWSTGYVTKITDGSGQTASVLMTPINLNYAAPGYLVAGFATAPPQCAIIGSTLAFPIWNPVTGKGGVAFLNTSTNAVTATTGLANTTQTGAVTTDATNFYALFGGSADSTVVSLTSGGVVNWTTALGSPGQPGAIGYVANTTSLYVSNPLNAYTLNTSGTVTGGGIGIGLLSIFDGGTLTPPTPTLPGTDTVFNRNILLIAVSNGAAKIAKNGVWTAMAGGSNTFNGSPEPRVIRSAVNQQRIYYCDGFSYNYYDPVLNKIVTWTASQGVLPKDSGNNFCRLIETWRGRTVLSGLPQDPQNWFMSAVNDPSNWNYLPTFTTPTQAVAGNNSFLGLVGDAVTGMIPYTDDVLIFGGDHTLWMMRGDPMAGGNIELVSQSIGLAWGRAWCQDPYGNVYFFSSRMGIYQFVPGQQPIRISQPIEQLLQQINPDDVVVRLAWDDPLQGVHVFVTHVQNARPETHYFYELRSGAWWTTVFGKNEHSPFCAYSYYGATPQDRVCLIGSWDGHVRAFQLAAANDEGIAINSIVVLGPFQTQDLDDVLIKDFQAVLGSNSGLVSYQVLMGQTAEQALMASAVASGTLSAVNGGRNPLSFVRRSGYALWLKLSASNPWALEQVRVRIQGTGKVRRRGVQI